MPSFGEILSKAKSNKFAIGISIIAVVALILLAVVSVKVFKDDSECCDNTSASKAIENFSGANNVSGDGEVPLGAVETEEAARLRRRLFNGNNISKHSLPTMSGTQQYEVLPRKPHHRMVGRSGSSVLPNQYTIDG